MPYHSDPTRTLPDNPSLAELQEQAKELLECYKAGEPAAVAEVERFERNSLARAFALADAQRVLARAYGFSSWAALKDHVEGVNFEALLAAAEAGDVATVRRLAKAHPEWISHHADLRGGALHRAVLRRDEELTRVLMQLGANARAGIWPHSDASSAHAIALDSDLVLDRRRLHCRLNSSSKPGHFPCLIRRRGGVRLCLMARRTFLAGT